jgi:hypothetical protein
MISRQICAIAALTSIAALSLGSAAQYAEACTRI